MRDPTEPLNEQTFAGWLAGFTATRTQRRDAAGEPTLISTCAIEERQIDADGRIRRCDLRFNSASGRKLASGELKRPEVAEGRDPRNEGLRADARRKAIARGLPYYFTCNMADVVLYAVANKPAEPDVEVGSVRLASITNSIQAEAYRSEIANGWTCFLDVVEEKLNAVGRTRPTVTTADVVAVRDAIYEVAREALPRAERRARENPEVADHLRSEALNSFNFPAAFEPRFRDKFRQEVLQVLRFGTFVITQKLVLYRVLEDAGPRRADPFHLDPLALPQTSTDPQAVKTALDHAFSLAIRRSHDYETAFSPDPFVDLVFTDPEETVETRECQIGAAWAGLLDAVKNVSWLSISQNVVGLLYEVIVDERFRHQLGQFYTPEDIVDLLTTFAIREPGETVLDPATGGGSFLRSAYNRKRALGASHESVLETIWGSEITAFAAELSTVTLATSDTQEPAAYPRLLLRDFFDLRPGGPADITIPGYLGELRIPATFDAVIGNPPYISYRRQTNQERVLNALVTANDLSFPKFSGKSDAYVWFIAHATQFLRQGGRLSFVVSSAILFSDYGIPLIRFIGHHYRICAVIDSMVERWFPDADTNTVLLMLERETDEQMRSTNMIRFVRLRRTLAQLVSDPDAPSRRGELEDLIEILLCAESTEDDPRMRVNVREQGADGGLQMEHCMTDGLEDDDE